MPATQAPPDRDIIVTGSRVITNGNRSPTPLTVVSTQQLLNATPAGVVEGLKTLPGLLGSTNNTTNITQAGYNLLNLRGVGPLRGLILFDGHRIGSTQNSGETGVGVIPQMLLQLAGLRALCPAFPDHQPDSGQLSHAAAQRVRQCRRRQDAWRRC